MSIGDFVSGVGDSISNTVDDVQQAASDAVDTAGQAASDVADSVAETASDVGQTVSDAASEVKQEAENAAAWVGHQADSFASSLEETFNPGAREAGGPEGFQGASGPAGNLDPNTKVDLSSPDARAKFLTEWRQFDKSDDTKTDAMRCQSNTAMAGLLLSGGPERLATGLDAAAAKAEAESKKYDNFPQRKEMLQAQAKTLREVAGAARRNEVTPGQLDRASDALFKTFDPDKVDVYKKGYPPNDDANGMSGAANKELEKTLGLTGGEDATSIEEKKFWSTDHTWGKDDNQEVSENLWAQMGPGESAHVSVKGGKTYVAQGAGPNGEKIESEGVFTKTYYYNDAKTGKKVTLDGSSDHAALFGKNEGGARYMYNPGGNPSYIAENPGDPQSVKKFDEMSKTLMARDNKDDYFAFVTKYKKA